MNLSPLEVLALALSPVPSRDAEDQAVIDRAARVMLGRIGGLGWQLVPLPSPEVPS
jgi:hypothetical protein